MKTSVRSRRTGLWGMLTGIVLSAIILPATGQCYLYTGSDWGGHDLTLSAGDTLSGEFRNVGFFSIPNGVTVTSVSDHLLIEARQITISGSLYFEPLRINPTLSISSPPLALWGSGIRTINYTPAPVNQTASGALFIQSGKNNDTYYQPLHVIGNDHCVTVNAIQIVNTSNLMLMNTPLPAAFPLFGSGLALLAFLRRKGSAR